MNIRKATIEDLKRIQELDLELFNKEVNDFDKTLDNNWPFSEEGVKYFTGRITSNDGCVLVVEDNGKIVGYFSGGVDVVPVWRKQLKMAELESVYIMDEYRNKGIGKQLMSQFLDWCKNKNVNRVQIKASAENEEAIRFYKRYGFKDYDLVLEMEL